MVTMITKISIILLSSRVSSARNRANRDTLCAEGRIVSAGPGMYLNSNLIASTKRGEADAIKIRLAFIAPIMKGILHRVLR
jgi:hypothetical protein